jgi:PTH1 family peptidyl-tRNA hydrolase
VKTEFCLFFLNIQKFDGMKFLIVGLGNPGVQYEQTRHNIGFLITEKLVTDLGGKFTSSKLADIAEVKIKGRILVVIKPTTYMNLSGKAVNYWMQQEKIQRENILVITDDISLPFGKIRMKGKGSDGGHNGLKDIQAVLNSQDYARLRLGVGNDFPKGRQSDYVLGPWNSEEISTLSERIEVASEAVKSFATIGLNLAMTQWNNK